MARVGRGAHTNRNQGVVRKTMARWHNNIVGRMKVAMPPAESLREVGARLVREGRGAHFSPKPG